MAVTFKVPASPKRSIFNIDEFMGVDMTNSGTSVDERMSPNAPNMIRDVPGKVRKRMGYKVLKDFGSGVIYGAHVLENTVANTGDFVSNRNMASTPKADIKIEANSSIYIYSDVEIPVGVGVHISFSYKTDSVLTIHPYVSDYSTCDYELDTIGSTQDFHQAFGFNGEVSEPYNAFEIKNDSASPVNLKLSNIMVYINKDSQDIIPTYRGFQTVQEAALYKPNPITYSTADTSKSISSSAATEEESFAVNANNVMGLVQVDFDVVLEDLTDATLSNILINYNCDKNGTEEYISTVENTSKNTIHVSRVIDTAYNHDDYDLDDCKLVDIVVTVNVKDYTTWTATLKLKNFKINAVELKSDYYEEGGLTLIHIDNELYKVDSNNAYTLISSQMNEHRSKSWQFENKLYIVDGKTYWIYDDDTNTFCEVYNSSYAHIPLMYISCNPEGGGTKYEDKNLLNNAFEQRFLCDNAHAGATDFQLIFSPLSPEPVTAKVMDEHGEMQDMVEDEDFSVDRATGVVSFDSPPGETAVTGEDNVYITAHYDATAPMSKPECISKCTIGTLFGINGATDRLFLSGNPDYLNVDWHSDQYDPGYFADTSYSKLGRDISSIVGYTLVNNYLAAHKDENETEHNIIVREGDLVAVGETTKSGDASDVTTYDERPAFKIINTLQGPGAIAQDTFGYLQTEPLFLTRSGVFAITAQDITGEKYSQNRSFYVNGSLLKENGLESAYAVTYKDMYFLFVNSKVYVVDGLQPIRTDKSEPYATRQYVCFYLTDIPATIAWVQNQKLYFGTTNGKICCFHTDDTALESYNDNGSAIQAWWETADLDGKLFYKNKSFRYIAVRLLSEAYSTVTLYARRRGIWSKLKEKNFSNVVFSFSGLSFSTFTFNNDSSDPVMSSKMRVKKIDKARFKIENSNLNQPFGIHDLAIEYVENGNFRG